MNIWKLVSFPSVLIMCIDSSGSVPNRPGAKMLVSSERIVGTVGGGIAEHDLIEKAKLRYGKREAPEFVEMEHREDGEKASGMICSGNQTFVLVDLDESDSSTIEKIIKADGGSFKISSEGIEYSDEVVERITFSERVYSEPLGKADVLYIVGGGHVSLALAKVMSTLDFRTVVIDDRDDLPTMDKNSHSEKKVVEYSDISDHVSEGENVFIAIMTFAHKSDESVLERLISKDCKYIGMMASPAKAEAVFKNLQGKGISKELIGKVSAPIGLPISSNTPEEIAISIAAEIIKVNNS